MQGRSKDSSGLYLLIAVLTAAIFAVDTAARLGLAVWAFYVAPVILCVRGSRPLMPLALGFGTSALVVIGFFFATPAVDAAVSHLVPINRAIIVVVLCLLGFFSSRFVTTKVRLLEEDWIKQGHSGLALALRGDPDLHELGRNVVTYLARHLEASVGSIWFQNDAGRLVRCAGWAAGDDANAEEIAVGEGLVGQAAAERRILVIRDVPEGFLDVRSGVGTAPPRLLILAPLLSGGRIQGIVELGFFTPPSAAAHDLLERVAELIGAAVRSARFRARQAELLEETTRQADELQDQRNELRAANEELEEQSRSLVASQGRLEAQQAELVESNARLEEQARTLEEQKERLLEVQGVLQHKAGALERASRYKSEFLANMSHELRTPLNSTLILAKLLADNRAGNLTPEQVDYASNIYSAGNDLLVLINDILDLAKIESGTTELSIGDVPLRRLLEGLENRFAPMAREKGLSLSLEIDEGCPEAIETDPVRLQQVLTNLLSNAIKFTDQGKVEVSAVASPGRLEISVHDTGIGIPSHQHRSIFEAFHQADGTTSRRYGGTGLGLSISRELVHLLGGEIRVESAPHEGSRFTVELPVKSSITRAPPAPIPPPAPIRRPAPAAIEDDRDTLDGASRTVLAIEDDPIFAAILRELAHELGFRCLIAPSGDEGLRLAAEFGPVAIVLDIGLPDHSGLTVLELLKRNAETRHIPIHVVSVHDYQRVALEMGAIGYALKPVKRDELEEAFGKLDAHLSRSVRNVLVVEDDAVQRDAIAGLLGGGGVEITRAATADEAFEKLRALTFDCVVLDLMLPETSGFDLVARMGEAGASFPPVIVYTARALSAAEEHRLRQHAKSIIVKGARSPERLLEEVTLFLHQVEADLPPEKRRMLRTARHRDAIFEGRTILLVEDDVRNVFALTSALEPKGANIQIARNGREALERLRAGTPVELVLMDVMMPEMNGLDATREIRKIPALADLPIIALTAKAMPDDRRQCLEAGANDYLAKPVDVEKLISMVRVWMPR